MVDDVTQTDPPAEHRFLRLTEEEAEIVLSRSWRPNVELCTRGRILRIIAKKVRNRLLVPTKANALYHLYIEIDLLTYQAARSIFFDWTRWNPVFTAGSRTVRVSFAARTHHHTATFLRLHDGHEMGIGPGIFRKRGQTFVMALPPILAEHTSNDETEGITLSCSIMTLHCNGTYRFKTPTATEQETAEEKEEREAAEAVAVDYAWEMVAKKVRMTCGNGMDPRWIKTLAAKTGDKEWEDYLSTGDEMSDDSSEESERSEQSE